MGRFRPGEKRVEGSHTLPVRDLTRRRDVVYVESGESGKGSSALPMTGCYTGDEYSRLAE
jgi:hypothetical protein